MGILKANKAGIRELYLAELKAKYPFYTEGSRPLALAERAVDSALAGLIKLDGDCWFRALETYSLPKTVTMKALAALPETAHS
jgi:hypothetical protein